jgi:hypothetical protein
MLENVKKDIEAYYKGLKQANEMYREVVSAIKKTYLPSSSIYDESLTEANKVLVETKTALRDEYIAKTAEAFKAARTAIKKAVVVEPSEGALKVLPLIEEGKLKQTEIDMIIETYKGNYMDMRYIHKAMHKHFLSVEYLIDRLNYAEKLTDHFYKTCKGASSIANMSYRDVLTLNTNTIEEIVALVNEFLDQYGKAE